MAQTKWFIPRKLIIIKLKLKLNFEICTSQLIIKTKNRYPMLPCNLFDFHAMATYPLGVPWFKA